MASRQIRMACGEDVIRSQLLSPSTILAIEACQAAVRRLEHIKRIADEFESFRHGPVERVLNPEATDEGGIKGGIQSALKILKIDQWASQSWNVDDAEDVQAEVLSRVQQRLDQTEIPVLLRMGWNALRRMASQELTDALDKLRAQRRGGTGGRKVRKAKRNVPGASAIGVGEASHLGEAHPAEKLEDVADPWSANVTSPATLVLATASKLGPRAHQYFKAIAAGADQKSAAQVVGITTRMARRYQQQLRALLSSR